MADAESNIIINVDTSIGIAEIKNLQRQISELNAQLLKSGAQQAKAAQNVQRNLISNINATGKFAANVRTISSTAESFTSALESNKLSMGQYFKYAGASTRTFGRLFKSEFSTIEKVATERVKTLQTQYIKLGRDANGALKSIAVRPLALDMKDLSTQTALAAQKQQLFNQLVRQGSTNLLNFGKNTQWAGRQLMVGFTLPLGIFAMTASKAFMQLEEQAIRFKRVYGDSFTATAETDKMIEQVQALASEFTKYGVEVEKTMAMAADAAAMGLQGGDLLAQISQATNLAVLGGVEQEKALETTISLMNVFGTTAKDLAGEIDFLNAVENQTVTAIEDLSIAIPKAAPVIKQLGGDVQDLAFFLTAMKEGGINASEGANALKSGLARMINPTEAASDMLKGFGINIKAIVEGNAGDIKSTVLEFAGALDTLDPLNRARAIEKMFGKFQFSRISTLFQNVVKEGTQAQRVLELTRSSSEELAILSERELKRVEDSPMYKFQKAVEDLKVSLAPLGEAFLKAITPVVEFAKGFLDRFNNMSDGAKNFAVVATTVVAGIGPVLLMTFGLVANGVANLIKMFASISMMMQKAGGSSNDLAMSTEYMTQQQLEAAAVAASLDQTHAKLIQTFSSEAGAVDRLATSYGRAVVQQSRLLGLNPETGLPIPGRGGGSRGVKKYNKGVVSVPGPKGAGDIVPAMLSPGEAVIPAKQSKKYSSLIHGLVNDSLPGYRFGLNPFANMLGRSRVAARMPQPALEQMISGGKKARYSSAFTTGTGADYLAKSGYETPKTKAMRSNVERDLFGLGENTNPLDRPTYGYARTSPIQALINKLFGFRGKQFNAVTSGKMIGDRGKDGMIELAPGKWIKDPSWKPDKLKRYGDVDVVTKRGVAKRSQAMVGDALLDYERVQHYSMGQGGLRFGPAPMRGASRAQLDKAMFDQRLNNPFGSYKPDPINNPNSFTANPTPPYVETYTPGGFRVGEISKIIAKDRSTARQLQKLVDQAGLKIRVTPQNAPMAIKALSNIFGTRFNDGTVGVKPRRFYFSQDNILQAAHLAPEAPIPAGQDRLSREQMEKHLEKELNRGVRVGAITPSQAESMKEKVLAKLSGKGFDAGGKLYSSQVGLTLGELNQKVGIGKAPVSAKKISSWLQKQPLGMLGGSSLLATDAAVAGNFSDDITRSYGQDLDASMRRRLKALGNTKIDESGLYRIFKDSQVEAENKIQNIQDKRAIKLANRRATLQINPGFADPGGRAGLTRKYAGVDPQAKAQLSRERLASIFGYRDNFFRKNSVLIPDAAKNLLDEKFVKSLTPKQRKNLDQALSKASVGKFKSPVKDAQFLKIAESFRANPDLTSSQLLTTARKASSLKPSSTDKKPAPGVSPKTPVSQPRVPAAQAKQSSSFSLSKIMGAGGRMGAFAGILGMLGLGASVMGSLQQNQYADGVVSVPGPKGKGDVIPAMLSPGEAVIPTRMARKYAPLISGMVNDSLPGFFEGTEGAGGRPKTPEINARTGKIIRTDASAAPATTYIPGMGTVGGETTPTERARLAETQGQATGKALGATKRFTSAVSGGVAKAKVAVVDFGEKTLAGKNTLGANLLARGEKQYQEANAAAKGAEVRTDSRGRQYGYIPGQGKTSVANAQAAQKTSAQPLPKRGGGMGGLGMMAGMGAMAYGATGGRGADIAMMASMPLMMAPMLMPLLTNPIGGTAIAVAAFAAGMFVLQQRLNSATKSGLETGKMMSMTSDKLETLSESTGMVTASSVSERRRDAQLSGGENVKREFGQNFMDSEAGANMLSQASSLISQGVTSSDLASTFSDQLSYAILQGAVTTEQARSIAVGLGEKLGDYSIGVKIAGELTTLFGFNGENLETDPLKISIAVQEKSLNRLTDSYDTALSEISENTANDWVAEVGGGLTTAATALGVAAAASLTTPITAVAAPFLAAAAAVTAVAGLPMLITGNIMDQGDQEQNNKLRGVAVQLSVEQLAQNQGILDSLDMQYEKQIRDLETKKEAAKTDAEKVALEEQINQKISERDKSLEIQKQRNNEIFDGLLKNAESLGTGFTNAVNRSIDIKFENATGAVKEAAELAKNALAELPTEEDGRFSQFKATLQLGLASGEFDPVSVLNLLNASKKDPNIKFGFEAVIKATGSTADANQLLRILAATGTDVAEYPVIFDFMSKGEEIGDFQENLKALSEFANMPTEYGIEGIISTEAIDAIGNFIKQTEELDTAEPITLDVLTKYMQDADMDDATRSSIQDMINNWDTLTDGTNELKYQVLVDFLIGETNDAAIQAWFMANNPDRFEEMLGGGPMVADRVEGKLSAEERAEMTAAFIGQGQTALSANSNSTNNDGASGTGEKKDPFEDILSRLKLVRNYTIDAAGGLDELKRAFGKFGNITIFKGTDQLSELAGFGQEFASYFMGLDEDARKVFVEFKKGVPILSETGQLMRKAFQEAAIGEFQFNVVLSLEALRNQKTSLEILSERGVEYADALALATNETIALAIASGELSGAELDSLIAQVKELRELDEASRAFDRITQAINDFAASLKVEQEVKVKYSYLEASAILNDDTLMAMAKLGQYGSREFATRLAQVMSTIEFKQGIFDDGFNKAMEAFSAREQQIILDFELGTNLSGRNTELVDFSILRRQLADAENEVAKINFQIDDLDASLENISEQEEAVNEKYDDRLTALEKIENINENIARQQKSQLTIADALSQGDISSAAKAAQELAAADAAQRAQDQKDLLEQQRESELGAIVSTNGENREQIELRIKDLKAEIFAIEEATIEPISEQIRLADFAIQQAIEGISVLDRTRLAWEQVKNGIDIARTSSVEYANAMQAALDIVKQIVDYWNGIRTPDIDLPTDQEEEVEKPKERINSSYTVAAEAQAAGNDRAAVIDRDTAAAAAKIAVHGGGLSAGGVNITAGSTLDFAEKVQAQVLANRAAYQSSTSEAEKKKIMSNNIDLMQSAGLRFAMGGVVPKYFAAGGFARGTDTVPAMLTPGEFVVRKYAVDNFGTDNLKAINSGTYSGDSVYNYSVNVNVKSDANPDQIARSVMTQIKQIDSQRIRSNKF